VGVRRSGRAEQGTASKRPDLKTLRPSRQNVHAGGNTVSASFTPNFSRNLRTGNSEMNSAEMKKAHIRVFHDMTHPSQVVLPVIPVIR